MRYCMDTLPQTAYILLIFVNDLSADNSRRLLLPTSWGGEVVHYATMPGHRKFAGRWCSEAPTKGAVLWRGFNCAVDSRSAPQVSTTHPPITPLSTREHCPSHSEHNTEIGVPFRTHLLLNGEEYPTESLIWYIPIVGSQASDARYAIITAKTHMEETVARHKCQHHVAQ